MTGQWNQERPTGRPAPPADSAEVGRALLTGWFSFLDGEVTAGDVLALRRVQELLESRGTPYDTAWSPGFLADGLRVEHADPRRYAWLLFVCGPLHGRRVAELHERFPHCTRIAVGVSVISPDDPAVTGFHRILPRDAPGSAPLPDLSVAAPRTESLPVAAVVLTGSQREYAARRRHLETRERVAEWLRHTGCALLELDTRLATDDWRLFSTADQLTSVLARLDVVVTNRLHGLVLALRAGVPALAVDPVEGGAKVTAQARALDWPAVIPVEELRDDSLRRWWDWCLDSGRAHAARHLAGTATAHSLTAEALAAALHEPLPANRAPEPGPPP